MLNFNQVRQFVCGGDGGVGRRKKLGRFIFTVVLGLSLCFNYVLFREIMEPSTGPKVKMNFTFINDTNVTVQDRAEREEHQVCRIPDLDPFNPAIKHLFFEPADPGCDLNTTRMFNSTFDSKLVPAITLEQFKAMGVRSCCYRVIYRDEESFNPEEFFRMSVECYPVSLESPTEVKQGHEFIAIFCENKEPSVIRDFLFGKPAPEFMDLKAFVHLKDEVERRLGQVKGQEGTRLNVAFFGFDAVSRLNFVRFLPKTRKFLLEEMGAIEMLGHNKVASNTLPNLVVLLTSVKYPQLKKTCLKGQDTVYWDNCPFIWKQFSEKGYRTAFAEDLSGSAIFIREGLQGFLKAPTDYYLRPFNLAASTFFEPRQPRKKSCFGHRLIIEVMLEYMTHFIWKMGKERKPFFYFSWEGSLTHDELNDAQLADEPTLNALKTLKENQLLNETMLIIGSDHGMRFGAVQYHRQGQLEDMLPLLYIVLPKWFQQTYPRAYRNLKENTKRFTTHLDLHFTLRDILNPGGLQDKEIERREKELLQPGIPKGMSLFLPIPLKRTCKHTVISPSFYCVCAQYQMVNKSKDLKAAREGAIAAVETINKELAFYRDCATLELKDILMVQKRKDKTPKRPAYLINFRTTPGDAEFQALVLAVNGGIGWGVAGSVVRRNAYGNQSHCVESYSAKELCFCK